MKYKLSVCCASGIESITKKELSKMGFNDPLAINGRIAVEGDAKDIFKLNTCLRTAERVLLTLASAKATSFDDLFNIVYDIDWKNYLPHNARIIVTGKSVKSQIFAISASQKIVKKAIIKKMTDSCHINTMPENGDTYRIEFSFFCDNVTISLDSSGEGLHKRGYRDLSVAAPIKETIAAAMIMLSDWSYTAPLYDLCCGSGTIPIEAALYATNTAPNINRDFDCNNWNIISDNIIKEVRTEAKDNIIKKAFQIYGSDISKDCISISYRHAKRAGMDEYIHFSQADLADFHSDLQGGTIICNLPYGERLSDSEEVKSIYKSLGKVYSNLNNWSLFALTSFSDFEKFFGKKADKKRKLYNADIECNYYSYFKKRIYKEHQ